MKCALWLREQAVQPGDIIGICTHNHLESYVPLLAAFYVGAISNPWDNELSPSTLLLFVLFQLASAFSAPNIKPPNEIGFPRIKSYIVTKHSVFIFYLFSIFFYSLINREKSIRCKVVGRVFFAFIFTTNSRNVLIRLQLIRANISATVTTGTAAEFLAYGKYSRTFLSF